MKPANQAIQGKLALNPQPAWIVCMESVFSLTVGITLGVTAMLKAAALATSWPGGGRSDPLIEFLSAREILLLALVVEVIGALIILASRDAILRLATAVSIAAAFGIYRLGVTWISPQGWSCPCLGVAANWLPLDGALSNLIPWLILGFMFGGGIILLIVRWLVTKGISLEEREWIMPKWLGFFRRVGSVLVILSANQARGDSPAEAFEVEGTIDYNYRYENSDRRSQYTNWFRVSVKGCQSVIRAGGMTDERIEFFEYSCDGTNSALLISCFPATNITSAHMMKGGKLTEVALPQARTNLVDAQVILNSGVVPEYVFGLITPVWLAYASGCFYARGDSGEVEPVFFMGQGFRESGLKVRAQWQRASESPGLLAWMCDFYDGNRYGTDGSRFVTEPLPAPFNQPTTNVFYQVVEWTNSAGYKIPLRWKVERFRRNVQLQQLELESVTEGTCIGVRAGTTTTDFAARIPSRARITDRTLTARGLELKDFSYITYDGAAKTLPELQQLRGFQVALAEAQVGVRRREQRWMVVLAIVCVLAFPVVLVIWRRKATGT